MRAGGGYTVQQALTPEAAAVVKQAVGLARRRGHAQVSPLHVASTMLSSTSSLLRSACLESHSHPLQCKALELCFNVALNRLPASSSSPILGGHHHYPSLSNALVAAFKRAQAHQRRGSIESQQQPLLAIKIELEQLVISILDDPSVSRIMREASFSSTQVKANVEQAVSPDTVAPTANPSKPKEVLVSKTRVIKPCPPAKNGEDVLSVVEGMSSGSSRRSVAVVGECLASAEGVVRGVMDMVERGEVPELLLNLRFIKLPLSSFRSLGREEVEQKVGELRCLVKSWSCCVGWGRGGGGGALLYLGDLSWAAEYYYCRTTAEKARRGCSYCPVEHVIMEIRGLLSYGGGLGLWVMGVATYQTYMSCRAGNPSLEALLCLQAITIPAAGLELSLNCDRDSNSLFKRKRSGDGPRRWPLLEDGLMSCCSDCSIKLESEARDLPKASSSSHGSMITSTLPSWLQQYKDEENKRVTSTNDQESLQHLYKKWNWICDSTHKQRHYSSEITLHFSNSASPSSSSVSSYDQQPWAIARQWKEQPLWIPDTVEEGPGHSSRFYLEEFNSQMRTLDENPNPIPNWTNSSSDTMEMEMMYLPRFKEISAENLKVLSDALEKKVPWQKAIIPEIASTILQCRSGMLRRKDKSSKLARATWLFFQGGDVEGKERIARELASLIFGSHTSLVSIELSTSSSSSEYDLRNKRSRSEDQVSHSHLERLFEAVRENPHRVFLVEDIERVDYKHSRMGIKAAVESGTLLGSNGQEVGTDDTIVILSCESFDSRSRASSPPARQIIRIEDEEVKDHEDIGHDKEVGSTVCLDLNLCAVDEDAEDCSFGLLDSVDRAFFFNLPEGL